MLFLVAPPGTSSKGRLPTCLMAHGTPGSRQLRASRIWPASTTLTATVSGLVIAGRLDLLRSWVWRTCPSRITDSRVQGQTSSEFHWCAANVKHRMLEAARCVSCRCCAGHPAREVPSDVQSEVSLEAHGGKGPFRPDCLQADCLTMWISTTSILSR